LALRVLPLKPSSVLFSVLSESEADKDSADSEDSNDVEERMPLSVLSKIDRGSAARRRKAWVPSHLRMWFAGPFRFLENHRLQCLHFQSRDAGDLPADTRLRRFAAFAARVFSLSARDRPMKDQETVSET
jgi:hypothetical protein